jgi:hypothetical protein
MSLRTRLFLGSLATIGFIYLWFAKLPGIQ